MRASCEVLNIFRPKTLRQVNFYDICDFASNLAEQYLSPSGHRTTRWYGTPFNIFKDDRILKNEYNHGFEYF